MSGHEFQTHFANTGDVDHDDQSTNLTAEHVEEMRYILDRYPQPRSAIMPMLHYVQSVDGRVSPAGVAITACI